MFDGLVDRFRNDDDQVPESPEDRVEIEEAQVISDLESLQDAIEKALEAEINLFEGLNQGVSENTLEDRIGSIEIYLEDDIEPKEKSIVTELKKLEEHEKRLQSSEQLLEEHKSLLEVLQDAISKTENEIQRLEKIVEGSKTLLDDDELSHVEMSKDEIREKVEAEIKTDAEEVEALEDELETAEEIEEDIRQS